MYLLYTYYIYIYIDIVQYNYIYLDINLLNAIISYGWYLQIWDPQFHWIPKFPGVN